MTVSFDYLLNVRRFVARNPENNQGLKEVPKIQQYDSDSVVREREIVEQLYWRIKKGTTSTGRQSALGMQVINTEEEGSGESENPRRDQDEFGEIESGSLSLLSRGISKTFKN